MSTRLVDTSWAPWAGLVAGPIAWAADHQLGSDMAYVDCARSDALPGVLLGAACLIAASAAAWLSWTSRTSVATDAVEMRRFVGWIGAAGGALFALAIALQTTGGILVPICGP